MKTMYIVIWAEVTSDFNDIGAILVTSSYDVARSKLEEAKKDVDYDKYHLFDETENYLKYVDEFEECTTEIFIDELEISDENY